MQKYKACKFTPSIESILQIPVHLPHFSQNESNAHPHTCIRTAVRHTAGMARQSFILWGQVHLISHLSVLNIYSSMQYGSQMTQSFTKNCTILIWKVHLISMTKGLLRPRWGWWHRLPGLWSSPFPSLAAVSRNPKWPKAGGERSLTDQKRAESCCGGRWLKLFLLFQESTRHPQDKTSVMKKIWIYAHRHQLKRVFGALQLDAQVLNLEAEDLGFSLNSGTWSCVALDNLTSLSLHVSGCKLGNSSNYLIQPMSGWREKIYKIPAPGPLKYWVDFLVPLLLPLSLYCHRYVLATPPGQNNLRTTHPRTNILSRMPAAVKHNWSHVWSLISCQK